MSERTLLHGTPEHLIALNANMFKLPKDDNDIMKLIIEINNLVTFMNSSYTGSIDVNKYEVLIDLHVKRINALDRLLESYNEE